MNLTWPLTPFHFVYFLSSFISQCSAWKITFLLKNKWCSVVLFSVFFLSYAFIFWFCSQKFFTDKVSLKGLTRSFLPSLLFTSFYFFLNIFNVLYGYFSYIEEVCWDCMYVRTYQYMKYTVYQICIVYTYTTVEVHLHSISV